MWIEISCWMDLRRSLEVVFSGALRSGILSPRWVPYLGLPSSNCTCTPASSQRFLALLSITFFHLWFVAYDLVIHALVHYILNNNLGRPKSAFAAQAHGRL